MPTVPSVSAPRSRAVAMHAVLAGLVDETAQTEPAGGIGKPELRLGLAPQSAVFHPRGWP